VLLEVTQNGARHALFLLVLEAELHEGFGLREVEIPAHAAADGRTLVDAGLPAGVLVVLIRRAGRHLVPQGRTVLAAGDRLLILADDAALKAVRETLTAEPRD
jgi:Trk K+ transport system NAD-binding subunit